MLPRDAGSPEPTSNPSIPRREPAVAGNSIAGQIGTRPPIPGLLETVTSVPPGLAGSPDMPLLLKALRRRWLMALGLGLMIATFLGGVAWHLLSPRYTAFSQIRIAATQPGPNFLDKHEGRNEFNTYLRSQASQLRSRFVLNAAINRDEIKKLNLDHEYADVVAWVEEDLKVEFQNDNELIKVLITHPDPDVAKALVNAITQAYKKEVVEKEASSRAAGVAQLDRIYTQENAKLLAKKATLKKLSEELGTPDSESARIKHQNVMSTLTTVQNQHQQVSLELMKAQGRLAAHKSQEATLDTAPIPEIVLNESMEADPVVKQHRAKIQKLDDIIQAYKKNSRDSSQQRRAEGERRDTEKELEARRKELGKELETKTRQKTRLAYDLRLTLLQTDVTPLLTQERNLRTQVEELRKEAQKIGTTTADYDMLKNEVERETKIVADLGNKLAFGQMDLQSKPRVTVYHEAALQARDMKKQIMATVLASVASVLLVCFAVAWWEFRRRRIHSLDEIATGLGIRVVGTVPTSRHLEQMIQTAPENEREGELLESIDAIRTLLLRQSGAEAARVLMVTSAEGGEGKTTLAGHLAGSLARAGRKTLLIDGDLRQPAVHQLFELPMQPGFSEVVLGEVDTLDAIQATNIDGLMLLPAGEWDREVLHALARSGLQGVFEKLKEEFDFIIVDSHPVLMATDSLLIGQNVDAVILAVLRNVSQSPLVYAASQRMGNLGIRVLGAVVNGVDSDELYTTPPSYTTAGV